VADLDSTVFIQQIKDRALQRSQAEIDLERQVFQNGVLEADSGSPPPSSSTRWPPRWWSPARRSCATKAAPSCTGSALGAPASIWRR
jgi:hypothetical protein